MKNRIQMFKAMLVLTFIMASAASAHAYDFSAVCNTGQTLYYNILSDSTVAVTYPNYSNESYYHGYIKPSGTLQIPATVSHGGSSYRVISLGNNAFYSCTGLMAVSIPSSVSIIGDGTFYNCTALSSIVIPDNVTTIGVAAFQSCSNLHSLHLGNSVATIASVAFEGCSSLTSLSIPNSVTSLGNWAFSNCTGLDSLYIGNSLTHIAHTIFSGCNNVQYLYYNAVNAVCGYSTSQGQRSALPVAALNKLVIGDAVQHIQPSTFTLATQLDTVIIGVNVSSIGQNAFGGCSQVSYLYYNARNISDASFTAANTADLPQCGFRPFSALSTLVLGDSVTRVPANAFIGQTISGTLSLPAALLSIGSHAFQGCHLLTGAITLPSGFQSLGIGAFQNCDSLLFFHTGNANVDIPANAFNGCSRLFQVTLGNNTHTIGDSAFLGCSRLTSVSLGNAVSTIGSHAFQGCSRLATPTFPNGLTSIGVAAFKDCSAVGSELHFPSSIATIGDSAFHSSAPISLIVMESANPPAIGPNTFASATSLTAVHVPCGAILNYYMADYWNLLQNYSESIPFQVTVGVNNPVMGTAEVILQPTCSSHIARIQATANPDYHFIHWSDGNTNNPRLLIVSSDTAFTAVFVSDTSNIFVYSSDTTRGTVTGPGRYGYNQPVVITATPTANNHFQRWNDGNTSNPRYFLATQDSVFTAIFLSNISVVQVLNANPTMGSVSGSGIYNYQDMAVISATPLPGHHFVSWNDGVLVNPRTISVSQDTVFTASFAIDIYNIQGISNNTTMGTVSGGGLYEYHNTVTITATPNYGYHFVQWDDSSTVNPRTFLVDGDSVFTAIFAPNVYTLSVTVSDTNMGAAYGGGSYNYNNVASISAQPVFGYHFVQWNDGNIDNPRTVVVTGNITYTAQFAINNYSLLVNSNSDSMGTVLGSGNYVHNTQIMISAIPNHGYHFVQWNDGITANPRLITLIQNATYTAQFAPNSYVVSASSNNSSFGTVSGGGTYNYHSSATLSAVPSYGYHFVQWSDGVSVNPRSLLVSGDTMIVAQFAVNNYNVTALSDNPAIGTVAGGGIYNYLSTVFLSATPVPHHHFVGWSDGDTTNPRTLVVTSDTLLTAQFAIDTHVVSILSSDTLMGYVSGGGNIPYGTDIFFSAVARFGHRFLGWNDGNTQNPRMLHVESDTVFTALFEAREFTLSVYSNDSTLGQVTAGGSYTYGTLVTLEAQPAEHCYFQQWSDGVTSNPRRLVLTSDSVVYARFAALEQYTVTVASNDPSMGSTSGTGRYYGGENVIIRATPFQHYVFEQWSDGNTDNPRVVSVFGDFTYTAVFDHEKFTITAQPNNSDLGAVYGSGKYNYGSEVTLTAHPFPSVRFDGWSDGETNPSRVITVTHNATYTALFTDLLGIDDIESPAISITTQDNNIIVSGASGKSVAIFDMLGRRVSLVSKADEKQSFSVSAAGVYLVCVEGTPAQKAVVR